MKATAKKAAAKKAAPKLKAPVEAKTITDTTVSEQPEPFGGKGDHDGNGKPGGDAKAQPKEPRPMPKEFNVETVREGSMLVARQDGIEIPVRFTEDKDEAAKRADEQREAMWAALEDRRIKALG